MPIILIMQYYLPMLYSERGSHHNNAILYIIPWNPLQPIETKRWNGTSIWWVFEVGDFNVMKIITSPLMNAISVILPYFFVFSLFFGMANCMGANQYYNVIEVDYKISVLYQNWLRCVQLIFYWISINSMNVLSL